MMGRYEWVIIEFLVLGLCVWELVNLRLSQRRDRRARAREDTPPRG